MADETFDCVWDAIADSPGEAAVLKFKSNLMRQVIELVKKHHESMQQLGLKCALPEERVEHIAKGKIAQVEISDLFRLVAALGYRVDIQLVAQKN